MDTYTSPFGAPAPTVAPPNEPEPEIAAPTAPVVSGLDVTVDAFALKQALTRLKPANGARGSIPALRCAKMTATGGHLRLVLSDLELTLQTTIAQTDGPAGEGLLPFADVLNVLAKTTAKNTKPIRLTLDDPTRLTVAYGQITTALNTVPVEEYPRLVPPAQDGYPVVLDYFGEVARVTGTDDARPILTGVYMDATTIAGTDSYRLHVIDDLNLGLPENHSLLIPARAMRLLAKIGGPAVMVPEWATGDRDGRQARDVAFWTEDLLVSTRCIEGEFPRWRTLVPTDPPASCQFDLAEMRDAVTEVNRLVGGSSSPMRIGVDSDGALSVRRLEQDRMDVTIKVTGELTGPWDGQETAFAVNSAYFLDLISDMVVGVLRGTDTLKPAIMSEPHPLGAGVRLRIVMPVRVT